MTDEKDTAQKPAAQAKHSSIAAALAAAQRQMGPAVRSANNQHFNKKYADLSAVMDACLPSLNENGIAVVQPPTDDETGRYVETILIHADSGETLKCRVPLIVAKNDMQGYGSAVTYARRYGLMSMAGIAPEDDDGNAAVAGKPRGGDGSKPKSDGNGRDAAPEAVQYIAGAEDLADLKRIWDNLPPDVRQRKDVVKAKDDRKAALTPPITDDEIPY